MVITLLEVIIYGLLTWSHVYIVYLGGSPIPDTPIILSNETNNTRKLKIVILQESEGVST